MQKYGIIQNGELLLNDARLEGYKSVVYLIFPEFNQENQYVEQGEIVEFDDRIEVGFEVKNLDLQDVPIVEDVNHDFVEYPPRNEQHEITIEEERITLLEDAILALMME